MKRTTKWVGLGAFVGATVIAGVSVAGAGGNDDAEPTIKEPALSKASAAALAHTGEGRVSGTEVGDEDSYFEVEVTLDDGSQVDVQLDEAFSVVSSAVDAETRSDQD